MNTPPIILCVDDEPMNLRVLIDLLQPNYQTRVAPRAAQALKALETLTPDLILLDIMMPEMDGFELCQAIKAQQRFAHTPIIFVTAKYDDNDKAHAKTLGAVDLLTKPIQPEQLKSTIEHYLHTSTES